MKAQLSVLALFAALAAAATDNDTNMAVAINNTDAENTVQGALELAENITSGKGLLDGFLDSGNEADGADKDEKAGEGDGDDGAGGDDGSEEDGGPVEGGGEGQAGNPGIGDEAADAANLE